MTEIRFDARYAKRVLEVTDLGPLGAAWAGYYEEGLDFRSTPTLPRARGVIALKKELVYLGFEKYINVETAFFGSGVALQTKAFQKSKGLQADGVVGPQTAKAIFKKRVAAEETAHSIPDHLLCKLVGLESAFDPGATGYVDARDRGLLQINSYYHPEVTDDEAFDPAFSIRWGAEYLVGNYNSLKDWDAACAAHNIGLYYARKWNEAGKPTTGLYWTSNDGIKTDYAAIATNYVRVLKSRTC